MATFFDLINLGQPEACPIEYGPKSQALYLLACDLLVDGDPGHLGPRWQGSKSI